MVKSTTSWISLNRFWDDCDISAIFIYEITSDELIKKFFPVEAQHFFEMDTTKNLSLQNTKPQKTTKIGSTIPSRTQEPAEAQATAKSNQGFEQEMVMAMKFLDFGQKIQKLESEKKKQKRMLDKIKSENQALLETIDCKKTEIKALMSQQEKVALFFAMVLTLTLGLSINAYGSRKLKTDLMAANDLSNQLNLELDETKQLLATFLNVTDQQTIDYGMLKTFWNNHNLKAAQKLIQEGANINARFDAEDTLLHLAAGDGHVKLVEFLLQNNVDIDAKNNVQKTPLHLASENGHHEIAEILLQNGANVSAETESKDTPLFLAAQKGHFGVVTVLAFKADVNAKNDQGKTVLHVAVEQGHEKMVWFLLRFPGDYASINEKCFELQNTPLHVAARDGHVKIAKDLIAMGANINGNVNEDDNEATPLHLAAFKGNAEIVKALLEAGARVDLTDSQGYTPLKKAEVANANKWLLNNHGDFEKVIALLNLYEPFEV